MLKSMQNETPIKISIVFQWHNSTDMKHFLFSSTAQATVLGTSLIGGVL